MEGPPGNLVQVLEAVQGQGHRMAQVLLQVLVQSLGVAAEVLLQQVPEVLLQAPENSPNDRSSTTRTSYVKVLHRGNKSKVPYRYRE